VNIDGILIETDRVATPGPTPGEDLWWSAKHHNHGGNVQVVTVPDGWPISTSDVRPGREHAGLLRDPGTGGVGGDTGEMHTPVVQLDEEQHVQPLQEHGVHGEEVADHDAGCLAPEERPPGRGSGSSTRRRLEAVGAQNPGDGAGGDPAAKPQQLPADALVAPAWVLPIGGGGPGSRLAPHGLAAVGVPTGRRLPE
jgi:hypothetical protein